MTARKTRGKPGRSPKVPSDGAQSVEAFLATLAHPLEREIRALRTLVLGLDPAIREELKWSAPSFAVREHFATFHLRSPDSVTLVLHLGAKGKATAAFRDSIVDPDRLLEWRGAERATLTFHDLAEIRRLKPALLRILRQWIKHVQS